MAVYHLTTKPISRAMGRSGPAASAYRSAEIVHDHSTGETWDYTRKQGVEHSEIVLPTSAAERDIHWARDREQLWNAAEAAEKRKDARVAREYEIALPHELSREERLVDDRHRDGAEDQQEDEHERHDHHPVAHEAPSFIRTSPSRRARG